MHRQRLHRRSARAVWAALAGLCFAWFAAGRARADVPSLLPIQGYLTDKAGRALDGRHDITFRLYAAATGDTTFHSETIEVVVIQGHFNAYLGDNSDAPLDLSDMRDHAKVFLGMEVENDGEGVPRLQLAATAFAAQSAYCGDATNLGGKAPNEYAESVHTHSWSDIIDPPLVYAPAPHAHGSADIMCYADLGDEGYLNNDDPNDLLLQSQGDDRYASKSHSHDAGDIQSGVLAVDRYSCYYDLNDEGYLNNDSADDLLTQSQGDGRWVKRNEGNSVSMAMTNAPIGSNSTSLAINMGNASYIFPSPGYSPNSNGSCVLTVQARTFTTNALPSGATFYVYPAVESNGTGNIIGQFAYAQPATNIGYYTTGTASGQYDLSAGVNYRFGCYVSVTNQSPFGGLNFTCIATWVCN